jgi:DNA-binding NarL/FixJ family response regulator
MTGTGKIRVMLVEDHAEIRRLVAAWVDREPDMEVVAQAGSLVEARSRFAPGGCDVAVLDMALPDGYGSDLIAGLRGLSPAPAALVLSASVDMPNLARGRGRTGYWTSSRGLRRSSGSSGASETRRAPPPATLA